jgi:lipoprotein releasing system, transmembrane protein, LolC/E family
MYEVFLALRYLLRSKSHRGFVSFFSLISVVCVIIGVAALIIVLSVMTGFEKEMKTKVISVFAHVTITGPVRVILPYWKEPMEIAKKNPHVKGVAPYIRGPVLLSTRDKGHPLVVLGMDPDLEDSASELHNYIKDAGGTLTDSQVILGDTYARNLGVEKGDKVVLTSPAFVQTPGGRVPVQKTLEVAGIFHSGNFEYDSQFGLTTLAVANHLFQMKGAVHALKVSLDDVDNAGIVAKELSEELRGRCSVQTWMEQNAHLFAAVQLEKRVMFLILLLISLVAALNIVSTLVMVVLGKTKDIGILRALGATSRSVGLIFTIQGLFIAMVGLFLGVVGGTLIAYNVNPILHFLRLHFGIDLFPANVYYLDGIPSQVVPVDVATIACCAFVLCLLASIFPALLASRMKPVQALRYE